MGEFDIVYCENELSADDFITFQRKMGWSEDSRSQLTKSLTNTLFSIIARKDNEVIGMGRLLGDAAMYWYINDVFILTEYQSMGIGKEIVFRLIQYAKLNSISGTSISINLMSAQGKEGFYEKLGFLCRPNEGQGSGMDMVIEVQ